MMETGIRAGESSALSTADLDLPAGWGTIHLGKGGRGRVNPVGPATTQALEAYRGLRQNHPGAEEPTLWLGARGTQLQVRRPRSRTPATGQARNP